MLHQLALGSLLISLTLALQAVFIGLVGVVMKRMGSWHIRPPLFMKTIITLIATVLWLLLGITLSTWVWACAFVVLGAFETLEPALYFSTVTLTTLGYGDITLAEEWRMLGSLLAVNGLIVFGLNTAFLVELFSRIRAAQDSGSDQQD